MTTWLLQPPRRRGARHGRAHVGLGRAGTPAGDESRRRRRLIAPTDLRRGFPLSTSSNPPPFHYKAQARLASLGLSVLDRSLRCSTSNPLHGGHPMATKDTAPEAAIAATTDTLSWGEHLYCTGFACL